MDSETIEVGSTFPAPPSQYKYFSQDNLDLLEGLPTDIPATKEAFVEWYNKTKDEDIDVDLRTTLVKPRVDWILEDGYYSAYGELWPLKESLPSLKESGVEQLYPDDLPVYSDKKPVLHSLLRTILMTHFDITRELTAAPPPLNADPLSRVRDKIEHIRLTGINMHHIINELRPMQAKETLNYLQQQQQDKRKTKIEEIKAKHEEIRQNIATLQQASAQTIERVTKKENSLNAEQTDTTIETTNKSNASNINQLLELINDL
ncbi:hypothetical protein E3Q18_01413 [Wallemia mellicola]|uniref:Mediator of RNA polymerase II transcription subunit 7 n=1 Tax=Wallemia mellicola TaxID=1708541 RepID=A0A4T0PU41_9BASI|nr:hypothetical protein E3Q18_01413 [Wallemia mellicola]TIC14752.1 hypothetical protein E3Q14_00701 [Wallemia mellicola]TIC29724.1 hypothetical protein E3Q11_01239 [Wallemia mellicola]TIC33972.1 hypothetical protein E3Q10_00492 [Wallemia mellicola]TIC68234.1 hypothetical protein E3Q01_00957 [Wallemia mellicola]